MLQKSTDMDVLRDNNKLCIVEDIELNVLKTPIEHTFVFLNDKKGLRYIHTTYDVVLNDVYRQNKTKRSKCDNFKLFETVLL